MFIGLPYDNGEVFPPINNKHSFRWRHPTWSRNYMNNTCCSESSLEITCFTITTKIGQLVTCTIRRKCFIFSIDRYIVFNNLKVWNCTMCIKCIFISYFIRTFIDNICYLSIQLNSLHFVYIIRYISLNKSANIKVAYFRRHNN